MAELEVNANGTQGVGSTPKNRDPNNNPAKAAADLGKDSYFTALVEYLDWQSKEPGNSTIKTWG